MLSLRFLSRISEAKNIAGKIDEVSVCGKGRKECARMLTDLDSNEPALHLLQFFTVLQFIPVNVSFPCVRML